MPTILFFLLLTLVLTSSSSSTTQINQHRRILHQPFFPIGDSDSSLPPTIQPPLVSPQQQPTTKYPFSTTQSPPNQQNPFFPFYPSPPPPPPPSPPPPSTSSLATFPANISSLILPQSSSSSSSKPISRKLVAVAVAVSLLSLSLIVFIAALLVYHRRHRRSFIDKKKAHPRSDNLRLFPPNTATSDKPQPQPPSSSSSEFLYLGTVGNSRSIIDENEEDVHNISRSNVVGGGGGGSSSSVIRGGYQKLGSPELYPLPPLPRHNNNFKAADEDEDEEEEFFSPRGSSSGGGKGSPPSFVLEGSRRSSGRGRGFEGVEAAAAAAAEYLGRSSINSKSSSSYPSSSSSSSSSNSSSSSAGGGSPVQSMSSTISRSSINNNNNNNNSNNNNPLHNHNSNNNLISTTRSNLHTRTSSLTSNSPPHDDDDSSVFEIPPPSRPPPPIPIIPTPTPTGPTPTPPSLIMPQSSSSPSSPPETSLAGNQQQQSPARTTTPNVSSGRFVAVKLPPPPPPPLPPPGFWETLRPFRDSITGPPVLVAPSRPGVVFQQNHPEQVSSSSSTTMIIGQQQQQQKSEFFTMEKNEEETPKPKLKPLHWDKVRASSDRAMVWDQLKSSSFQLNEEMIETLFMVNGSNLTSKDRLVLPYPNQENRVLDPKKSQNIAILLRALNVTIDEVCEALLEGNADTLGTELLESLLKMTPTKEEERKLREFKDESPFKLGPAEKFLKAVLDVPFAFKRVDAMLYIANFDSEVEYLKRSFQTLEAACEELRNSRMFMKLLEAVLKTGNRMNIGTNRGDAQAFKLDTLLKLVDIKGTDGKTTLLHFVVQEIIRAEGSRLSGANMISEENHQSALRDDVEFRKLGLQVVSGLSGELTNVKKAAAMDSDILSSEVEKLARGITKIVDILKLNEELALKDSTRKFFDSVNEFLKKAEEDLIKMQAQESVALSIVKEITEYFHGNSAKEEAHPFRIFMVVRDFLSVLDQVCKEVGKINERSIVSSARQFPLPINPGVPPIFPGFNGKRHSSSSDDDDDDTSCSP